MLKLLITMTCCGFVFGMLGMTVECEAGPFFKRVDKSTGYEVGSDEYYQARANASPAIVQHYKYGKAWPPFPRPTGPAPTFHQRLHAAIYWPYPYNVQDQAMTEDMIDAQQVNGWKNATTLYSYHFNPETNELNSAGLEQLTWIVSSAPDRYKAAYVAAIANPEKNDARMQSVQNNLSYLTGNDMSIPVSLRISSPIGRPAFEVEKYQSLARDNMPPPILKPSAESAPSN
jgi:hypothetical protein